MINWLQTSFIMYALDIKTMEKEITENYHFTPTDYNEEGRRKTDGMSFRDIIKGFERDFHEYHSTEYALNLYANSQTMILLSKSCGAAPFLTYGMDLTQGKAFDAEKDPYANRQMEKYSERIFVYGIDSAFMTVFDEHGYPIIDDDSDIYPLTLLIDDTMREGTIRLAVPTLDDEDNEAAPVTIDVPQFIHD